MRLIAWALRLLLAAAVIDGVYLLLLWNERSEWLNQNGTVAPSRVIEQYARAREQQPDLPPLRWRPVAVSAVPAHVVRAILIAEDDRFYDHHGFDVTEIRAALAASWKRGRIVRGASTISQQTARNLFLSSARHVARKWHESVLTVALEATLTKQRILEIYVNIAELGEGVYGVDAAAQFYWRKPLSRLTPHQAAELAAALPAPTSANPHARTAAFRQRAERIYRRLLAAL